MRNRCAFHCTLPFCSACLIRIKACLDRSPCAEIGIAADQGSGYDRARGCGAGQFQAVAS
jgi:hypothetical protein